MTGAFSLAVNGNKRWFPEIADIPVLQKRRDSDFPRSRNRGRKSGIEYATLN